MELFELIQTLNRAHGPSGDEGEIREVIRALAEPYADEITADTMGSLIVHRRGKGPKLLLAAHMDSIGFVVTHIEKEGFLRVGRGMILNLKQIRRVTKKEVVLADGTVLPLPRGAYEPLNRAIIERT